VVHAIIAHTSVRPSVITSDASALDASPPNAYTTYIIPVRKIPECIPQPPSRLDVMEALHGNQTVQVQIVIEANQDDIFTDPATPVTEEQSALSSEDHDLAKQRASLDSYLKSLPYACETEEQMHVHLEHIFGRIAVCVETKNWMVLTTWDGLLEWCARNA
jgi:hypothetical protein